MTPFTLAVAGGLVFLVFVLLGIGFGIAESPPGIREPIGARVCFAIAIAGVVLMFGATIVEVAIRFFAP